MAFVCAVLYSGLFASSEDWIELGDVEKQAVLEVIDSALVKHSTNTDRGWCKARIDTHQPVDQRIVELELSWSDTRVGVQVRDATQFVLSQGPVGPVEVVSTFGSKEYWVYHPHPKVNTLTGYGGTKLRTLPTIYECRPHRMWLSFSRDGNPMLSHRSLITGKSSVMVLRESASQRIRIRKESMTLEFDDDCAYSPVLFELHMDNKDTPESGRIPIRQKYDVVQDKHGVWYCRTMQSSVWLQGQHKPAQITRIEIMAFDSAPGPDQMKLDYKSIGARADTKVTSFIPGRAGSWTYGRAEHSDVAESALRELSKSLRDRGFASSSGGVVP